MNLPNKLTVLRVLLVPVFVVFLMVDITGEYDKWIALFIFFVACLTDFIDGRIARKRGLVTNFGKFMDPLADKLLVCSALICFVELGRIPTWMVLIIIAREFIISGFRLIAADNGIVIAASIWGKYKTAVSMLMIGFVIGDLPEFPYYEVITQGLIWISLILTVISLVDYIYKNRKVFGGSM